MNGLERRLLFSRLAIQCSPALRHLIRVFLLDTGDEIIHPLAACETAQGFSQSVDASQQRRALLDVGNERFQFLCGAQLGQAQEFFKITHAQRFCLFRCLKFTPPVLDLRL